MNFPGDQPSKAVQRLCDVLERVVSPATTWLQGKADASQIRSVAEAQGDAAALKVRAQIRLEREYVRHQRNLETIGKSAKQLLQEPLSAAGLVKEPPPVSEDWASRFFSAAQEVSNEQMQSLWAKILAGEIRKPNSFSLRTLDVVRNLSETEARLFEKVSPFAIHPNIGHPPFVPFILNVAGAYFEKQGLDFGEIITLSDAGLMNEARLSINLSTEPGETVCQFGTRVLVIPERKPVGSTVMVFTRAGAELLSLTKAETPPGYIEEFLRHFGLSGEFETFKILTWDSGECVYDTRTKATIQSRPLPKEEGAA